MVNGGGVATMLRHSLAAVLFFGQGWLEQDGQF
jgi:hypothetical protein